MSWKVSLTHKSNWKQCEMCNQRLGKILIDNLFKYLSRDIKMTICRPCALREVGKNEIKKLES